MTCEELRSVILALANPLEAPAPVSEHLRGCASCQKWWAHLRTLETLVTKLPVPPAPANKKARLLDELHGRGPAIHVRPRLRHEGEGVFRRRRVLALAGLAASVAIAIGIVAIMRGPSPKSPVVKAPTPHPFLERVVQRNVALVKSTTPAARLATLGLLADDVRLEARDLARVASVEDLKALAGWYDKLVREGLVTQAEAMPALAMDPAAKAVLLRDLAGRLHHASEDAERLVNDVPPAAQESMRRMAETAKVGQQKLRQLAGGA